MVASIQRKLDGFLRTRGVMIVLGICLFVAIGVVAIRSLGIGDDGFQPIHNWNSLRITLQRTLCFGRCPAYAVEISGDGSVHYRGQECVAQKGERAEHIGRAGVVQLVDHFKAAKFFSLKNAYYAAITDNPTFVISIEYDGKRKKILDYAGLYAGMPRAVRELEGEVDAVGGTDRWVFGKARTCFGGTVDDSWRKRERP